MEHFTKILKNTIFVKYPINRLLYEWKRQMLKLYSPSKKSENNTEHAFARLTVGSKRETTRLRGSKDSTHFNINFGLPKYIFHLRLPNVA